MGFIKVGRIVDTHGIKGEVRIISNFELKDQVFGLGCKLYIGNAYNQEVISSYRVHKNYDMVCFEGYDNINQVLKYMKMDVFVRREDLVIDKFLDNDLIGMSVCLVQEEVGKVREIVYNKSNKLLCVEGSRRFYIPLVDDFVVDVDLARGVVGVSDSVKGLM